MTLDNGDKQLLREVHGSVSRIEGALPFLATKEHVSDKIAAHKHDDHKPAPEAKAYMSAKRKLILAIASFIAVAGTLLTAYTFAG